MASAFFVDTSLRTKRYSKLIIQGDGNAIILFGLDHKISISGILTVICTIKSETVHMFDSNDSNEVGVLWGLCTYSLSHKRVITK